MDCTGKTLTFIQTGARPPFLMLNFCYSPGHLLNSSASRVTNFILCGRPGLRFQLQTLFCAYRPAARIRVRWCP